MASITRGYASTRFGQVHYRSAGERRPGELPIVLLHQTPSSSVMFERVMEALSGERFLLAPDTPGFGGTEPLPAPHRATVALYAEAIAEALAHLDVARCFLFGHHSGASIAVQIAHDRPSLVAKLALSGPPLLTKADLEALIPAVSPARLEADGGHLTAVWRRIRAKDPELPIELVHREAVLNLHAGVRYGEAYQAVFDHDIERQLRAIDCPTLVMIGPDDPLRRSAEPAVRCLKRGALTVLPAGGAYVCDRQPELVAGALRGFFDDEGAASPPTAG